MIARVILKIEKVDGHRGTFSTRFRRLNRAEPPKSYTKTAS